MKKSVKLLSLFLYLVLILLTSFIPASAAITDAKTPVSSEEAQLKWSLKLGTSYANAPSVPAVSGDYVFTMSQNKLYKINAENGETVKTAEMCDVPSFGYTPVLIDGGRIFCPLEGGKVQAFDLDTMESLWVYTDPLGGQALSPLVFDSGLVYTGFWNDEEIDANYVCLDAENGSLKWSYTQKGGFYWAESAVIGDYLIIGGDNGSGEPDGIAALNCFNKTTGELIDTSEVIGDQRSGITQYNNSLYFVTKAGYIYKVKLNGNGEFDSVEKSKLSGASTSTPVIHDGKVYIGVQSSGFSGNIAVIDAKNLELIYSVPMNGYPQSEVLLTTAYDDVYIYSTYNAGPGGITVINGSSSKANQLFTPDEGHRSYCISPVSVTEDGTLIYKNDSGTIFAIGKAAPEEPEKTFFEKIIDWFKSIIDIILGIFG